MDNSARRVYIGILKHADSVAIWSEEDYEA